MDKQDLKTKQCSKCNKILEISQFYKDSHKTNGYSPLQKRINKKVTKLIKN